MLPSGNSTRWVLGGLGLLSVLIAVVAMGVVATRVLSDSEPQIRAFSAEPPASAEPPSSDAPPSTEAPPGLPADSGDSVPVDGATVDRCRIDQKSLEIAAQAYEAMHSAPPPNQDALVAADILREPATSHRLSLVDGEVRVEGLGVCAGLGSPAGATTTTWGP